MAATAAVYTVRVVKEGRTLSRKQVSEGLGRADAVVIKAAAGVIYVLGDAASANGLGAAPAKITTKRVGKNLHVSLAKSGLGNPDVPDLIIEGYFDFPPAPVMGTLESGALENYDLGHSVQATQANQDQASQAQGSASQAGSGSGAGGAVQATLAGAAAPGLGAMGWGLAILGGALALGGGGKGSSSAAPDAATAAQSKISTFANDAAQAAPAAADYTALGVTGVTSGNLAAINSAIDALASTNVDSKAKVQAVVDAFKLILAEANGTLEDDTPTIDPTAAQYALIGANIGAASAGSVNLSLLNDALGELASTAVDTINEINALAASANAVMTGAAGGTAPTLAQLGLLGITGVTASNLLAVQNAIGATADSGLQVDTVAELQAVVTTAASAVAASLTVLTNYATSGTNPAPLLTDFSNLGVGGVTASNLASMNSAVDALGSAGVSAPYKVQALVDAYTKIMAEANGAAADATAADPTSDDFAAIGAAIGLANGGIAGGSDVASNALSLLNDALGAQQLAGVDTVGELNSLSGLIDKVINLAGLATGASTASSTLTMSDLASMGVDTALADLTTEQGAILQAIANSADSGSGVTTILALQAIVNANAA
jgi:hypothetical protein